MNYNTQCKSSPSFYYHVPRRLYTVPSLLSLSSHVFANLIAVDCSLSNSIPPHIKTILVKLLGARNLLTCPVLRSLACDGITSVSLNGSIAKDSTARILRWFTSLETLIIPGNMITSSGFTSLFPNLPCLQYLDVSYSGGGIDDCVLSSLVGNCKLLKFLDMSYCPEITDEGLHLLLSLCGIRELKINGCTDLSFYGVRYLRLHSDSLTLAIISDFPKNSLYLKEHNWDLMKL